MADFINTHFLHPDELEPLEGEVWVTVKNDNYLISSFKRVWDVREQCQIMPRVTEQRSHIIYDCHTEEGARTTFSQHRLLAEAFIENPHGLEYVIHLDGCPINNELYNLSWAAREGIYDENHALRSINNNAKLRASLIPSILDMYYVEGKSPTNIKSTLALGGINVHTNSLWDVIYGKTWKHVDCEARKLIRKPTKK